jgi:integrase
VLHRPEDEGALRATAYRFCARGPAWGLLFGVFCISPQKGAIQDHAANAASVPIRISVNSQTISSFALNERWFATMALQKGILLAAVQKILGHERLGTTAIYLNLTDLHVVEEYAQKW